MAKKKVLGVMTDKQKIKGEVLDVSGRKVTLQVKDETHIISVPEDVADTINDHDGEEITITRNGDEYEIETED